MDIDKIQAGPGRATNKQTFGLDFDDTFTADPHLWTIWIQHAQARGHAVFCTTARHNSDGNHEELTRALPPGVIPIFCSSTPKRRMVESAEIRVDLWIDDYPEAIIDVSSRENDAWSEVARLHELVADLRAEITRLKAVQQ